MFCLGVVICIAGLCRVWYVSIYVKSWDFLCEFLLHLYRISRCLTNYATGHGTVLFVIICIETSIGIVCGCLPGCKPLFTKLFPSIFSATTNSNPYGNSGKNKPSYPSSKSADGRPFPFQIVDEKAFEVQYGEGTSSSTKKRADDDGDSGEWIMMQDKPRSNMHSV
jgi:hypothetical protein